MQNFNFLAFSLLLLPASLVALQCYETTGTLSINNLVQVSKIYNFTRRNEEKHIEYILTIL